VTAWAALAWLWWSLPPALPFEPPLPSWSGSIVRTDDLHLGVRPASDGIGDEAVTVQVTANAISL